MVRNMTVLNAQERETSRGKLGNLPLPNQDSAAKSQELIKHISAIIQQQGGHIPFEKFMELALYTPKLGYYCNHLPKFGAQGDFTTAPLISPLFSRCLARFCYSILDTLKDGDIVEYGAGSGHMVCDILIELEQLHCLPKRYFIIELSAGLKKRQQDKISENCPHLLSRVEWVDSIPTESFKGVILANELFDAMPVHLFEITEDNLYEYFVTDQNKTFSFQKFISKNKTLLEFYQTQSWPEQYLSEINLNLRPFIHTLANHLTSAVILFIDYGFPRHEYYHPSRNMGTLMCHYQHYAHQDPLVYPGLQDITAHVDFTAIAEAAVDNNLEVVGYTNQANFLINCSLIQLLSQSNLKTEKERLQQNNAIQKLTSPAEMGELFKVIAIARNFDDPLLGFQAGDKRHTL